MTSAEEKYGDIINLSWDTNPEFFRKHPRMDLQQRAKIFAPFAALRGHNDRLQDEVNKTTRTLRQELSEDEMNVLSAKMTQVKKGMDVTITYFEPDSPGSDLGYYLDVSGKVCELDTLNRLIRIRTGEMGEKGELTKTVHFMDLLDIKGDGIIDMDDFLF